MTDLRGAGAEEGRSFQLQSGPSAPDQVPRPQKWHEKFAVGIVFTIFVVFRAIDRAFLYRVQKYLKSSAYNLILSNLIWPVCIQLVTVCMLVGYVFMLRAQGHTQYTLRFFLPGNPLASSKGAVPLYKLALFSLGDQINAAMSSPPSPFISLPLQSIMTNFVLVWMLFLAAFWLGTQFKQVHFIGCALIILAVVVGIADKLSTSNCSPAGLQKDECLTSYKTSTGVFELLTGSSMVLWYGIFLCSTVPSAISNCYKQQVLKGVDLDVIYATWWSGNFQIIWGILLFWINWIPLPQQPVTAPGDTFSMISDTWECFIGNVPHPGDESCAGEGGPAVKWFLIYLCFNLSFNICLLWLTKRMSAMWTQIATTLCLDLTNIFSQFKFIVGDSAQLMTLCQWLATILASIALWTYNLEPEILPVKDGDDPDVQFQARHFNPSFVADGHSSLVESFSVQKTTNAPSSLLPPRGDQEPGGAHSSFRSNRSKASVDYGPQVHRSF